MMPELPPTARLLAITVSLVLLAILTVWLVLAIGRNLSTPRGETVDLRRVACTTEHGLVRLEDVRKRIIDTSGRTARYLTIDGSALVIPPEAICMEHRKDGHACMDGDTLKHRGRCGAEDG